MNGTYRLIIEYNNPVFLANWSWLQFFASWLIIRFRLIRSIFYVIDSFVQHLFLFTYIEKMRLLNKNTNKKCQKYIIGGSFVRHLKCITLKNVTNVFLIVFFSCLFIINLFSSLSALKLKIVCVIYLLLMITISP